MQARTKKTLALLLVALVIVVGGVAATVWKLVDSAEPTLPTITAYARGKTVTVDPAQHCNLYLEDCVENPIGQLDVPAQQWRSGERRVEVLGVQALRDEQHRVQADQVAQA